MTPPRRSVTSNAVRFELLVFVEGEVTEEQYLVHYGRRARERVTLQIADTRGVPYTLVEAAVKAKSADEKGAKCGRGRARDEYWCVFDVDEHPKLGEAVELAAANDIRLAITNPCLELWFRSHFEDQFAYLDRREAQRKAKEHTGCHKALSQEALAALDARFEDAKTRAIRLDEKHSGDQTPAPGNPSSDVWRIIESIILR